MSPSIDSFLAAIVRACRFGVLRDLGRTEPKAKLMLGTWIRTIRPTNRLDYVVSFIIAPFAAEHDWALLRLTA
jgi:hypothetical protein